MQTRDNSLRDVEHAGAVAAERPAAAVFRIRLFRPSETFIADQARSVGAYRIRFVGRDAEDRVPPDIDFRIAPRGGALTRVGRLAFGASDFYRQALHELRPALVHAHFGIDAVAVLNAAEGLQLPLVTTFHGYDATTRLARLLASGSPTLIRYALGRRRLAERGRLFICVSDFIRAKVLQLGFPEPRVVTHYIGTDLSRFQGWQRPPPASRPVVLHVARLVEKKGTLDLLQAFARARAVVPDAQVVIIGDGPLKASLEQWACEKLPADSVCFLGARPHADVIEWLKIASVFCLPSVTAANGDTEGLPISIIEAAAAGLPIVSTWHSGIPEAVQHGVGGLLVDEHDVAALADALTQVLSDAALARTLGADARAYVQEHFSLERQGRKLERLYADAAG